MASIGDVHANVILSGDLKRSLALTQAVKYHKAVDGFSNADDVAKTAETFHAFLESK